MPKPTIFIKGMIMEKNGAYDSSCYRRNECSSNDEKQYNNTDDKMTEKLIKVVNKTLGKFDKKEKKDNK